MTDAGRTGPPPEKRERRPAGTEAAHLEGNSSNAHYTTKASTDVPIVDKTTLLKMAVDIMRGGRLWKYLRGQRPWCRTAGENAWAALGFDGPDPVETELLVKAHTIAVAEQERRRRIAETERRFNDLVRRFNRGDRSLLASINCAYDQLIALNMADPRYARANLAGRPEAAGSAVGGGR